MRELLTSFALACAALALFWTLLFPKPTPTDDAVPRPVSTEGAPPGHAGLARWLAHEGVPLRTLRRRIDATLLGQATSATRTGNLLVVTLPEQTAMAGAELDAIASWVGQGNTLLLVAALDDTPRWAATAPGDLTSRLQRLSGLRFRESMTAPTVPAAPLLAPAARHPLTRGVEGLATAADLPASRWTAAPLDGGPVLVLFRRADTGAPAVWLRPLGQGAILVSAWASPFANAVLGREQNARFLAQVVGWSLRPGGTVLLDDVHQGVSDLYDPRRFYADPRLHHTLGVIVLLWFAWVLGWRPLRAAPAPAAGPDETALLRVSGGFLAQVLRPADAARELLAQYSNALRRRLALPENGEPPWDWLASRARVEPWRIDALRDVQARIAAGRRVDLRRLQNSLVELTERLT